ncbi:olfactory receptor 6F1-like [Pleurodeles waltl]|uniref:olfactory receptor 6F1-like n=1 Tax=Pleurodeles waltl TaxID=8319 RepID=UPI003709701B
MQNLTVVANFILVGFQTNRELEIFQFLIFLIMYLLTLMGNIIIITLVSVDTRLHMPMYIFLGHFSLMEIFYSSCILPKLMSISLTTVKTISFIGCFAQFYFFFSLGVAELLLLTLMSVDRYLAICNPLHYSAIINNRTCLQIGLGCWSSGLIFSLPPTFLISQLDFCGSIVINHFFCDGPPLLKISCTDTSLIELIHFLLAICIVLSSFLITFMSYFTIIKAILRIPSATGRKKTFSTCSSHLSIATIYYGTLIFTYVRPKAINDIELNKVASMFYTSVTPMINPMVYSLRNTEVRNAARKAMFGVVTYDE